MASPAIEEWRPRRPVGETRAADVEQEGSPKSCFYLLFFGAHPHQTCTVLDVVVVVVFPGACRLLSLLLQPVLGCLLLLNVLPDLLLEESAFGSQQIGAQAVRTCARTRSLRCSPGVFCVLGPCGGALREGRASSGIPPAAGEATDRSVKHKLCSSRRIRTVSRTWLVSLPWRRLDGDAAERSLSTCCSCCSHMRPRAWGEMWRWGNSSRSRGRSSLSFTSTGEGNGEDGDHLVLKTVRT